MTLTQWFIFFIVMNIIHGLATFKFYKKAGIEAWKAFVPFLNMYELMNVINRPKWWMIFVYIPIVNLLMMPVLWVQTLKVFEKKESKDVWLAVLTLGLYVAYVNFTEADKLTYNPDHKDDKDTLIGSLVFAIIAATIVHTYFVQPYTIPTASLEKSLLIGDYLFVSKFHYGARPPMTTVALPMVHDTIPIIKKRSYLKFPQLPYMRLPGFQKIKRNDIVVFNWPADTVKYFFQKDVAQYKPIDKKSHYVKRCVAIPGDSLQIKDGVVYINGKPTTYPDRTYLQHVYIFENNGDKYLTSTKIKDLKKNFDIDINSSSEFVVKLNKENLKKLLRQKKKDVGIILQFGNTNDDIVVVNSISKINDSILKTRYPDIKMNYKSTDTLYLLRTAYNYDFNKLSLINTFNNYFHTNLQRLKTSYMANLTDKKLAVVKKLPEIKNISLYESGKGSMYGGHKDWDINNFGPIYIPKKGDVLKLNKETYPLYKWIISRYDDHDAGHKIDKHRVELKGDDVYVDGKLTKEYTVNQDYYWMMGDNRSQSEDSRFWGYVPFDHVVGKPVFIFMSIDNDPNKKFLDKFRWDRIFTTVSGEGKRVSYLWPFIGLLLVYYAGKKIYDKKKA